MSPPSPTADLQSKQPRLKMVEMFLDGDSTVGVCHLVKGMENQAG